MTRKLSFSDRALVASLLIALLATGAGIVIGPEPIGPVDANAISWRAYTVKYKTASSFDQQMSREAAERFTGPIQYYNTSSPTTKWRIRARRSYETTGSDGWKYRWIYLENSAPGWNAWGMSIQVQVRYNGSISRVVPGTLTCRTWAFLVTVTKDECEVVGSGTAMTTVRMSYDVGWSYLFGSVKVTRGASIQSGGNGSFASPVYWP